MQSWPSPVNKVSGWKKGRKEQMEDILESLNVASELAAVEPGSSGLLRCLEGLSMNKPNKNSSQHGLGVPEEAIVRPVGPQLPSKSSLAPLLELDEGGSQWIMGLMSML